MKPGQKFWRIVIMLLFASALASVWALAAREKLVTDVFALLDRLPASGADREAMKEVIADEGKIVALRLEGPDAEKCAEIAASQLVASGAVQKADVAGTASMTGAGRILFESRLVLLFPRYLELRRAEFDSKVEDGSFEQWLAVQAVSDLNRFLSTPESAAFSDLIPKDPLLLLPFCIQAVPNQSGDGTVVMAECAGPATDRAAQKALIDSLHELRKEFSGRGVELHATGAALFANASETRIRRDIAKVNFIMFVLLLSLVIRFLRSLRSVLAIALPVVLSWLLAVGILFACNAEVYAFALAIGGILGGVTVDYPVHLMLHRHAGEDLFVKAFRRVFKPMTLGMLSSILVFLFLLFSDLRLLRQAGLLVSCGLAISYLLILPCFSAFAPASDIRSVERRINAFTLPLFLRARIPLLVLLLALAACAPLVRWNDSTDALQPPLKDMYAENERVLGSNGRDADRFAVSFGDDISDAISNARKLDSNGFAARLATGDEVRKAKNWEDKHGREFERLLRTQLTDSGYDADMFAPLFGEGVARAHSKSMQALASTMPAGFGWMLHEERGRAWIVSRLPKSSATQTAPAERSYPLDVRAQLEGVFRNYRQDTTRLALCGFVVASVLILAFCGIRRGLAVVAIPILSILATLGIFGLSGRGASLFTVIGLLLGYGLSMDYALFASQPKTGRASIRFSAYTSILAFAGLTTCIVPAIRSLGLSVVIVLIFTLLQCESKSPANHESP